MLSGADEMTVMLVDVLSGLDEIKICTAYELVGERRTTFPSEAFLLERCRPVYETLAGWRELDAKEVEKGLKSPTEALKIGRETAKEVNRLKKLTTHQMLTLAINRLGQWATFLLLCLSLIGLAAGF